VEGFSRAEVCVSHKLKLQVLRAFDAFGELCRKQEEEAAIHRSAILRSKFLAEWRSMALVQVSDFSKQRSAYC